MINSIYQLVEPRAFSIKFEDTPVSGRVIVRPRYMAICHADQRYYRGQRDPGILQKKLPMALIHEACGDVVFDSTATFAPGDHVVMIPNVPAPHTDSCDATETDDLIYENYEIGSRFLSSGHDGFMREIVALPPSLLVPYGSIDSEVAAITEFISVTVHATRRFDAAALHKRDTIAIWGDGSMGYTMACVLSRKFPHSKIVVMGRHPEKLALFSFASQTYLIEDIPADFSCDHAFECVGGNGSVSALDAIVTHCKPQATVMLMGVSENPVPIRTRDCMEKGLTLIGCSRSGRRDFEEALSLMSDASFQQRIKRVIHKDAPVRSIGDIVRVFATDLSTPFKTVFEWNI